MTKLRDYQQLALDEIRAHYASGRKRVLLHLATGGGKTVVFSEVLKGVASRGNRAVMVVRGKELIDQTSQRLFREGVDHGCFQGNHWNYKPSAAIQICSVDTLYRRKIVPKADLVVIDECHLANSPSFEWVIEQYPNAFFLPVSATPHHKSGFRKIADAVVYPITIEQLMNEGYLSRPRYYAPSRVDLTSVSIDKKTDDYKTSQLETALEGSTIYGEIVEYYKSKCEGRSAILFAVSVAHSLSMVERFKSHGISSEHIDANTPKTLRDEIIDRLKRGETKVVCNVGVLTTGVDVPSLGVVILARPTKSYNLFIQMCGRGTRITDEKSDFFVMDHANNLDEHGFIENERTCDLEGNTFKREKSAKIVTCKSCYAVYELNTFDLNCPQCGAVYQGRPLGAEPPKRDCSEDTKAKLFEVQFVKKTPEELVLIKYLKKALKKNYKPGWVYYKIKDELGNDYATKFWPIIKSQIKKQN